MQTTRDSAGTESGGTSTPSRDLIDQRFRPDLDGLRAVAILLVVGFHAGLPGFSAGFIGVDVFFVISGYLITRQLDGELVRTGTVRLATFWARRARRLLPAATIVLVFVSLATPAAFPVFDWKPIAAEIWASSLYVANEAFLRRPTGYFAAGVTESPLLNMWSLSVEEQFYVLWPLTLVGATALARVRRRADSVRDHASSVAQVLRDRRRSVVLLVGVASFTLSVVATQTEPSWAYFATVSRAWEFAVGAVLALSSTRLGGLAVPMTRASGALGTGLLVLGLVAIDSDTPFPGLWALLPVLGTAGIIMAGSGRDALPDRILGVGPLRLVGRLSYSWYLWHWPVMILGLGVLATDSTTVRTVLVLVSLVPATLAHHLVERPLRSWHYLTVSNGRTLVAMLLLLGLAIGSGTVLWLRADVMLDDPFIARVEAARVDRPPLPPECATNDRAELERSCVWGDKDADRTILLYGDSHAAHWLPGLDLVGKDQGFRVVASMQGSCPGAGNGWVDQLPTCTARLASAETLFEELAPDLVVMSNSVGYQGGLLDEQGELAAADDQTRVWERAIEERADGLEALGIPLLVILDVPRFDTDPVACLVEERDGDRCGDALEDLLEVIGPVHTAERTALDRAGWGSTLDPLPLLCVDRRCPVYRDGLVVYGDQSHLTPDYARSLREPLGAAVTAILDR